jgi:hypothetical protein
MGYWYEPSQIKAIADKHGLSVRIVHSTVSPYRFHAVLQRRPAYAGTMRGRHSSDSSRQMARAM